MSIVTLIFNFIISKPPIKHPADSDNDEVIASLYRSPSKLDKYRFSKKYMKLVIDQNINKQIKLRRFFKIFKNDNNDFSFYSNFKISKSSRVLLFYLAIS